MKNLGAVGSPSTAAQEDVAQFYVVNSHELPNRTMRAIAESEGLALVEQARLFAMLNMAAADSLINCWNAKAFWSFWRPITAIRKGDNDRNAGPSAIRPGRRSSPPRRTPITFPGTTA